MNKTNKILLVLVILLVIVLAGLIGWQKWGLKPSYSAVYLRTGDLYFGRLMNFPSFGLKNVYTLQVNQQNQQNPVSIQKFANIFWGPQDFLKINRSEVVWMTKLNPNGQLAQLLKTNPDLQSNGQPNPSIPSQPPQGNGDSLKTDGAKDANSTGKE